MPPIHIRAIVHADAQELLDLALAQGADLDGFSWRKNLRALPDELAFIDWARSAEAKGEAFCRAIVIDGRIAGCASLYHPHPTAFPEDCRPSLQMGYWVGREFRGQGAGSAAMRLLMSEVGDMSDQPMTVGIRTRSRNAASLSLAAKLGLTQRGIARPSMFDENDIDLLLMGPLPTPAPARAKPKP